MARPKKVPLSQEENLDLLTSSVTSYATFEALVGACKSGYLPTLLPVGGRAKKNLKLADALEERGCKVWRGIK